jgi:hypothetical protein
MFFTLSLVLSQRVPKEFSEELLRLKSQDARQLSNSTLDFRHSVVHRTISTISYASKNVQGHESVVVELYLCGYVEKVRLNECSNLHEDGAFFVSQLAFCVLA